MALFNKKPQTADEIMALIKNLPDEELAKLGDMLTSDDEDGNGKPDTMEQIEKAEENIEEKGEDSQSEKDRIDESVGEQEKLDNDEDSQDAKDRVDEAEGEEKALDEEKEGEGAPTDKVAQLESELKALKEVVEALNAKFSADAENDAEEKQEFGIEMQANGSEAEEESDLEKAKKKYWAF